jgi:hypothetical protein
VFVTKYGYQSRAEEKTFPEFYRLDHEGGKLTAAIVDQFGRDVTASGAEFLVLTLPTRQDVTTISQGNPLDYADLLAAIGSKWHITQSMDYFAGPDEMDQYFGLHYTARGNRAIAQAAYDAIMEMIASGTINAD